MNILGLHASFALSTHDPAVSLISDGVVQGIYEEERFNRIKLSRGHFPLYSLKNLLQDFNFTIKDIDYIATTGTSNNWVAQKIKEVIEYHHGYCPPLKQIHHQHAHMWCALYSGCPENTRFVCVDAFGDGSAGIYGRRRDESIEYQLIPKSQSLGNFYAVGTSLLGFTAGEDEYKVMGLAAYGSHTKPSSEQKKLLFAAFSDQQTFEHISEIKNNYETFCRPEVVDLACSIYGDIKSDFHARSELAFDIQKEFELKLLNTVQLCAKQFPLDNQAIALAGGCALNCQANMILEEQGFNVYVSPVSSDRGIALGSALGLSHELGVKVNPLKGICYGQSISNSIVEEELKNNGLLSRAENFDAKKIARELTNGLIIGICSGHSEAGARALGRRSILADPTIEGMKDKLNKKIKYREAFRPFAPAILDEDGARFFLNYKTSRYMTQNFRGTSMATKHIPECIHADGTARVQSVIADDGKLHEILLEMKKIKGFGVSINTSFNLKGQPIVQTVRDALGTFHQCGIDKLIIGDFVLSK